MILIMLSLNSKQFSDSRYQPKAVDLAGHFTNLCVEWYRFKDGMDTGRVVIIAIVIDAIARGSVFRNMVGKKYPARCCRSKPRRINSENLLSNGLAEVIHQTRCPPFQGHP